MYIQIFWSHMIALCEKQYWNWIIPELISPISEQDQPILWNDSYKKIDLLPKEVSEFNSLTQCSISWANSSLEGKIIHERQKLLYIKPMHGFRRLIKPYGLLLLFFLLLYLKEVSEDTLNL